jgi:hypothetical protein
VFRASFKVSMARLYILLLYRGSLKMVRCVSHDVAKTLRSSSVGSAGSLKFSKTVPSSTTLRDLCLCGDLATAQRSPTIV